MTVRTRTTRVAATLLIAGATLLGTAGCTFMTSIETLRPYDPSDGTSVTVGSIGIRNALLLPDDAGTTLSLVMTILNEGQSAQNVLLQYEGSEGKTDLSLRIEGNTALSFGGAPDQEQLLLEAANAVEGSLLPVYVQYGTEPGSMMMVPVLSPDRPEYETLTPTLRPTPTLTPAPLNQPESPQGGADNTNQG